MADIDAFTDIEPDRHITQVFSRIRAHTQANPRRGWRQSNPSADALRVAAARVEHSSLRNPFST